MLIPPRYPLPGDLGFPDGVRPARERWLAEAKRERARSQWGAIGAAVGLTLAFAFLGMLPWFVQRAATPRQLQQHLSSDMPMGNAHLGAEYYNIASAIVDGRGFSDPFIVPSGPTAWMPPMLVWIQAALIAVFDGDRFWVMVVVVLLKTTLICACGALIVRHGWRHRNGWLAFGVVAAFLCAEYTDCFSFTHDSWLILGSVTATVFGLPWIERRARAGTMTVGVAILWGAVGGLVALTSPVAGFAWAVATTLTILWHAPVALVLAAVTSIAVITPWTIRNQVVLGTFTPVKSNVYFELDQSLAVDDDGLLDWRAMSKHPYHPNAEREAYVRLGETAYLATKKQRFLDQFEANPDEFYRRVRRRAVAVTLLPAGFSSFSMPSLSLPIRWLLYPWPAIAAVTLLLFGRPLMPLQRAAIVVYFAYLLPYIICSYYPRYGFPLLAVKILLCYWALERVLTTLKQFSSGRDAGVPARIR